MKQYEVIVGNIGTVYVGTDKSKAEMEYHQYLEHSKAPFGRASGEDVILLYDGAPLLEYFGTQRNEEDGVDLVSSITY